MVKDNKYKKLEHALSGGLIGAALGMLFTEDKDSTILAALVGAALGASYEAYKESRSLGVLYVENGKLYQSLPNGAKTFIKEMPKHNKRIPKEFTLA